MAAGGGEGEQECRLYSGAEFIHFFVYSLTCHV